MKRDDFMWLVGILEGEGTFTFSSSMYSRLAMTDKDIIERVANLFNRKCLTYRRKPKHKRVWYTQLCGKPALALMLKLKPYMGKRRQQRIQFIEDSVSKREAKCLAYLTYRNKRNKNVYELYNTGRYTYFSLGKKMGLYRDTIKISLEKKDNRL